MSLPVGVPALVLTAGLGTRLRPLSCIRAKPAMPVAGEPLVRRIVRCLAAAGISRLVLNLHHLAGTICAAVGDGSDLDVKVRYSWENPVLGSAGGPRRALPLLDADRFLIVNGDTLTDLDPNALLADHARSGALVTLAVIPNPSPERYGGVRVANDGAVTGFVPRGTAGPSWHFIGVQAAQTRAFSDLAPDAPAESVSWLYPRLMREQTGSVRAFRTSARFFDIGTPADYLRTCLAFAAAEGHENRLVGARCRVARSARLSRTVLWDEVTVGDDAALIDCIVADGACIEAGTRLRGCAIVPAGNRAPATGEERVGDLLLTRLSELAANARGTSEP